MSYIPPHKRHLKDPERPSPVPISLSTKFKSNLNLKKAQNIVYSKGSTSKWFLIGSNEAEEDKLQLVPFSFDSAESKNGEKPFVLIVQIELSPVRHLVVDVSCLDKDLDMRLMLSTKKKLMALTEKEINNIKELLDSASVDPSVKGGLRWSLGKTSSRDGYSIAGIVHIKATTYTSQTLRLKVQEADRFDMRSGTGEVKREVDLILKSINTHLQEDNTESERESVLQMFRDVLPTIWDFLPCDDA